ncbi:MAG: hypothetical protein ACK4WD_01180 [Flavobacteriales bacterium]
MITYSLLTLALLHIVSRASIYVTFLYNQESIAKTLCIKKDVPNNTCNGQCHLKKQLEKTENSNEKGSSEENKQRQVEPITDTFHKLDLPSLWHSEDEMTHSSLYDLNYHYTFSAKSFHPPALIG